MKRYLILLNSSECSWVETDGDKITIYDSDLGVVKAGVIVFVAPRSSVLYIMDITEGE